MYIHAIIPLPKFQNWFFPFDYVWREYVRFKIQSWSTWNSKKTVCCSRHSSEFPRLNWYRLGSAQVWRSGVSQVSCSVSVWPTFQGLCENKISSSLNMFPWIPSWKNRIPNELAMLGVLVWFNFRQKLKIKVS